MSNDSSRYILIAAIIAIAGFFLWGKYHPETIPHRPNEAALPAAAEHPFSTLRFSTPGQGGRGLDVAVSTRSGALTSVRTTDAQFTFKKSRQVPSTRDADPRTPNASRGTPAPDGEGLQALWSRISPPPAPDNASELRPDPDRRLELISTWEESALPLRMKLTVRRNETAVTPTWFDFEGRQVSPQEVELTWRGSDIEVTRTLRGISTYAFKVTTTVVNHGAAATIEHQLPLYQWTERDEETGSFFGRRPWQITEGACRHGNELFREPRDEMEKRSDNEWFAGRAAFLGLSNLYFTQAVVPDANADTRCSLYAWNRPDQNAIGSLYSGDLWWRRAEFPAGATRRFEATAYFGPKIDTVLAATSPALVDTINLRFFFWRFEFFNFFVRWMIRFMRVLHALAGNWGVAIILLTVCIRILLFPLLMRSMKSMAMMQKLKPELDEINRKFGDNTEARGLATMELQRKHGMSPFSQVSGCLPLFAQLPIWAALYSSLQTSVELFHTPFTLWYHDLSAPDPYFVLPLVLGSLMFLQQKLMPPAGMDPMQAKMLVYFMPGFMTVVSLLLPSGLAVYMLVNTLLGIVQQWYTKKRMDANNPTSITIKPVTNALPGDSR
jgi:YidC/Oxa1 family membrane protein insertase